MYVFLNIMLSDEWKHRDCPLATIIWCQIKAVIMSLWAFRKQKHFVISIFYSKVINNSLWSAVQIKWCRILKQSPINLNCRQKTTQMKMEWIWSFCSWSPQTDTVDEFNHFCSAFLISSNRHYCWSIKWWLIQ